MLEKVGIQLSDEVRVSSAQRTQEIDRILSQPELAPISNNIEKFRHGKKFDPAWYVPLGERNLRTMARTVGKSSEYVIFYSGTSEVMHTSSYERHVKNPDTGS